MSWATTIAATTIATVLALAPWALPATARAQDASVAAAPDAGVSAGTSADAGVGDDDAGRGSVDASVAVVRAPADAGTAEIAPVIDAGTSPPVEAEPELELAPVELEVEPPASEQANEPETPAPVVFVPTPLGDDQSALDALLPALPWGKWTPVRLLILLLGVMLLAYFARRVREWLPVAGAVPRLVRASHITLQLTSVFVGGAFLARILSPSLGPALPWMLVVGAAAVAWSARDVLPDLTAAIVLALEQRLREGMWVSGEGFTGIVERRGLRAVWLRDGHGNRIAVPNRRLLEIPVVSQLTEGPFHEVTVRLPTAEPARIVRQSLGDAVLTSPWVHPDVACMIRRDGQDPELWHVRAQLLDIRFAIAFDGDLVERAEDILAAVARERRAVVDDDWD